MTWDLLGILDPVAAVAQESGLTESLPQLSLGPIIRAGIIALVGVPFAYFVAKWLRKVVSRRYNPQWGLVAGKVAFYPVALLLLISVLRELGFSLTPLLGAAGVLGVAIGFASQTSVSNVISGFFLIGEQPFTVDDVIQVGDVTGRVLSVDMLSVKLRTFDNRYVRIPNEAILKSQVTNNTRFPIRRADLGVGVAYAEDLARVQEVLLDVADRNPLSLMEPAPQIFVDGFGDSAVNLRLAVWSTVPNYVQVKNTMQTEIKARFDAEGIEIPFPHRTLYTGAHTTPLPVTVVASSEADPGSPPRSS